MKIDWKWTIGSILAVIGIVTAVYGPEYFRQRDFNTRLASVDSNIEDAMQRIDKLRGFANGSHTIGQPPTLKDLHNDRDEVLAEVADANAQLPISSPLDGMLKLFKHNSDFLLENLDKCQRVNNDMLNLLATLGDEYNWILVLTKNERRRWTELFLPRDFKAEVKNLQEQHGNYAATLNWINGC